MTKGYQMPPRTEEHKQHLSEANRGKHHKSYIKTEIHRQHLSDALKGRHLSSEHIATMSASLKGRTVWNKGKTGIYSEETRQRISQSLKGRHQSPETIQKVAEAKKKRIPYFTTEAKLRIGEANKGKAHSIEQNEQHSKTMKERWLNLDFKVKWLKALRHGVPTVKPTKPEQALDKLLQLVCPDEYKYTGDGEVVIGGFIPDFINCNGQKQVIEMYGDYWHRNDNPQDRIDKFREYGFDCLVIWERDLKEQSQEVLLGRIRSFNNA